MSALHGVGPLLDHQRQPCLLPLTPKLGSSHDSHAPCMVRVMAALLLWVRGSFVLDFLMDGWGAHGVPDRVR